MALAESYRVKQMKAALMPLSASEFLSMLCRRATRTASLFVVVLCVLDPVIALADDDNVKTDLSQQDLSQQGAAYFEKKIRPLLHKHCYSCHSAKAETVQGGLLLDSRAALHRGGDSGPSVTPGKPEASLLIAAVEYGDDSYQMPPDGKLADREIQELKTWVERGAPFPKSTTATTDAPKRIDLAEGRKFWSFQTAQRQSLPDVADSDWPRSRLDWFVLAGMTGNKLVPSTEAKRATLIRRLTFDLTGLPPSPDEVAQFVADSSPDAYDRLVKRLLDSPRFGERWARPWLDLVRYTDQTASWLKANGEAHLYRDWVVRALNDDMPYDEFIRRQLATDMMASTGPDDLPALGFLGLSPTYWKELKLPSEIIKVIVADEWEERVDVVSRTFLGLTVACARCHDHKFDPIDMEDYYALAGVFASSRLTAKPTIDEALYEPAKKAKVEVERLQKELTALRKKKPVPEDKVKPLAAKIAEMKKTPWYDAPLAHVVQDESMFVVRAGKTPQQGTRLEYKPGPRDLPLFVRGNPNRPGKVIPRRFLAVLSQERATPFQKGSGRLELAESIIHDAGSLAARVIVNRIWADHFGSGLVATPSNFGQLGAKPTHPRLLEDLTADFIANGWSMKWLHREIVMSATYRQSSAVESNRMQVDPDNRYLSRMNRRRLDVESWRDAMLVVGGDFDGAIGGTSVRLDDANNRRRTIYSTIHRRDMSKMLQIHDFPDRTSHSPKRVHTTTPLQGLYLLNSPFVAKRAETLVRRIADESSKDKGSSNVREQIRFAHQLLFARDADESEIELGLAYLGDRASDPSSPEWRQYAHALLGCNEFLFVD